MNNESAKEQRQFADQIRHMGRQYIKSINGTKTAFSANRTPAQKTAYDLMQALAAATAKSGEEVKFYRRSGGESEFTRER